ncbi:hypothetical protein GCM10008018_43490 [Paenibacillus marchantiophytorum]|uniref:N-acetyltransferase domain-containing protein n=1 Tax=Paenibacillus marchantiophytorum TaxID=1619310 RepID=A0ABQ1EXU6_9BACL|nr:GNAT family N-acetyltransferase [Paenibacillus marchantiophytorum]GFZ92424.1 hypothetical protein GCM10008018_43490 [Paenibacillus marchantiophytorum]
MKYTIREAVSNDCLALSRLMTQLLNREITENIMKDRIDFVAQSPFDSLFVYEEEQIMGTLGFRIRVNIEDIARYGEISVIVVDIEAKRKGVGRILMKYAEDLRLIENITQVLGDQ